MQRDDGKFLRAVDDSLRNIKEQVRRGNLRANPAAAKYLSEEGHHDIVSSVTDATCSGVKQLLSRGELGRESLLGLGESRDLPRQGVYANIATSDVDKSTVRIYIGAAAGPYNSPRSRGMANLIGLHKREIRSSRPTTVLHHRTLRTPGWHACWTVLVAFPDRVSRQLVLIAQTVMTVLFGTCLNKAYAACRPKYLVSIPPDWGLNEMGPLGPDTLATYNKIGDGADPEEVRLIRERLHAAHVAFSAVHHDRRLKRARNGGPIHVNILTQHGEIKRFFITPMKARDGGHINISIPLPIGLHYGLQESRSVDMTLDLSTRNHHTPYAAKSMYNSNARRLGLLLEGRYAVGPQKGTKYSHWLQSNMRAGIGQAEKLIQFISNDQDDVRQTTALKRSRPNHVAWKKNNFVNQPEPERNELSLCSEPGISSDPSPKTSFFPSQGANGVLRPVVLQLLRALQSRIMSEKIRVCPTIRRYFKGKNVEPLADTISQAVRPAVAELLISSEPFTPTRLLSIGGNIRDQKQGVYADIVTNEDPKYFRIYVGSSAAVSDSRRVRGLNRRIREHLSFIRSESGRPESGIPHSVEVKKPGSRASFIILVRFATPVDRAVVHIAEAVMTILFASWDNKTFLYLRPAYLPKPDGWGLNNSNPMDFAIPGHSSDPGYREGQILGGRNRAAKMQRRRIANAQAGGAVRIIAYHAQGRYWGFRFNLCGESFVIPTALGRSLGLRYNRVVNVKCDIRVDQHPFAYAQKAQWESKARRLGICLKGTYRRGECKGQKFQKWIQCNSDTAVLRAERLIDLLGD
ncbi:hypothetical protein BJX96DRAFT_139009 [Aspergillus floccosus]